MDIITLDFETYYDDTYSLSKMRTEEYIRDDRFEVIGVSLRVNDEPVESLFGASMLEIAGWLHTKDWGRAAVRCHNTLFDGLILSHHFGIKPKLWMDTLAQARMIKPYLPSHGLAALAKYFGIKEKGTAVVNAKGKRVADFTPREMAEYQEYCEHDVDICKELGEVHFDPFTTASKYELIDMTIRMFTEPMLEGDADILSDLYAAEIKRKEDLMAKVAVDRSIIMSNPKLAAALEQLGVEPPKKISPRTQKETFAFAKSDREFTDLMEHHDSDVQALVAARLGVKTTIAETRLLRFIDMSRQGPLHVYLNFWGAKTTGRYSGGNMVNWQNLPARGVSAGIRRAIKAPKGFKVLAGDSSNIELRMVMALAGQWDVVEKLRQGVDMYCDFASRLFGRTITKADVAERFLGKTAMLGLQYGAGAARFQEMVRIASVSNPNVKPITLNYAYEVVDLYRQVHSEVVKLWDYCNKVVLPDIANGCNLINVDVNGWFITQREGFGRPGEPGVMYHDLKYNPQNREWDYHMGRQRVKIYGAKVVENLCIDGGALVLTENGWRRLDQITTEKVHDGVEFVSQTGLAYKGEKEVICLDGVYMTPDHEVLTDEGWKAASLVQEPYRPDIRTAYSDQCHTQSERQVGVAVPVSVWEHAGASGIEACGRTQTWWYTKLWVYVEAAYQRKKYQARYVQTSGLRCLQKYVSQMPQSVPRSMEKLRRAWDSGVQAVVRIIPEFLGRHGRDIRTGAVVGSYRQRPGVFATELPVGNLEGARTQQAWGAVSESERNFPAHRHQTFDAFVPMEQGATRPTTGSPSGQEKSDGGKNITRKVYDLINCGPRNRFVVLGDNGPFIVHNCQHAAMEVVMWQTAQINRVIPVKLSVHDEAVCVVPERHVDRCKDIMLDRLSTTPKWCQGKIPVVGEVGVGDSYGDAK